MYAGYVAEEDVVVVSDAYASVEDVASASCLLGEFEQCSVGEVLPHVSVGVVYGFGEWCFGHDDSSPLQGELSDAAGEFGVSLVLVEAYGVEYCLLADLERACEELPVLLVDVYVFLHVVVVGFERVFVGRSVGFSYLWRWFYVELGANVFKMRIQAKQNANYFLRMNNNFNMDKREQLEMLISFYADGNKSKFAYKLGIKPQTINTWLTRNTLDVYLIYSKCEHLSGDWLLTGEGEMLKESCDISGNVVGNISAKHSGSVRVSQSTCDQSETIEALRAHLAEKERTIQIQQQLIEALKK